MRFLAGSRVSALEGRCSFNVQTIHVSEPEDRGWDVDQDQSHLVASPSLPLAWPSHTLSLGTCTLTVALIQQQQSLSMSSVPSLPGSPGLSPQSSWQCPEHSLLLMISCPFLSISAISCLLIFSLLHFSRTPFKGQDGPCVAVGAVRGLDWWIPFLCSLSVSVILFPARRGQMRIPLLSLPWTLPCLLMTVVCGLSHSEAWEKGMLLREAQGLNLCALCSFRFL